VNHFDILSNFNFYFQYFLEYRFMELDSSFDLFFNVISIQ